MNMVRFLPLIMLLLYMVDSVISSIPIIAPGFSLPTVVKKEDLGAARPALTTKFSIGLKIPSNGQQKLTKTLEAVSNPSSPRYGHYLTNKQVEAITAPKNQDVKAVKDWLKAHGIAHGIEFTHARNADHIAVETTVVKAQNLFGTAIHTYQISYSNGQTEEETRLAGKPELPNAVRKAVQLITGI